MQSSTAVTVTLLGLISMVALPLSAEAWGNRRERLDRGYVIAESRYGGGIIKGAVRPGSSGRAQVQLPGGTWIDCEQTCSDTLRRETVDFWQSRQWPSGKDGPGYLHFRF